MMALPAPTNGPLVVLIPANPCPAEVHASNPFGKVHEAAWTGEVGPPNWPKRLAAMLQ